MIEKVIRDSNFELLRIVLIVMVICSHYLVFGRALNNLNSSDPNFYIAYTLESSIIVAVDCFILITGFFQINNKYHFKKVVDLWTQVFFYSVFCIDFFNILDI